MKLHISLRGGWYDCFFHHLLYRCDGFGYFGQFLKFMQEIFFNYALYFQSFNSILRLSRQFVQNFDGPRFFFFFFFFV